MTVTALHIAAGSLVLVVAPAALLARKGGRWHRLWGQAFALAMALVLATATLMWQSNGHVFLFALSLVSAYLVFAGYRIVRRRRRRSRDRRADAWDAAAAALALASGAWLLALAFAAATPLMRSLAPIVGALGVLAIAFAANDIRGIVRGPSRVGWQLSHVSSMLAAYISAVTAFVVINAHAVPMTLRWLVPSALGSALIAGYSLRVRALTPATFLAAVRQRGRRSASSNPS